MKRKPKLAEDIDLDETGGECRCVSCKWCKPGDDECGFCMYNPPVFDPQNGFARRPEVDYYKDYCSRWEKE